MTPDDPDRRLCSISTLWTVVLQARGGPDAAVQAAQQRLLDRYGSAIRRYLRASLRDAEAADDLFQEFAVRFLRGDYRNVSPERGRFRDYVKTVLYHLIANHHKQRNRLPPQLTPDHPEPAAAPAPPPGEEQEFLDSWREELLARCWAALDRTEGEGGPHFALLLRFRAAHPKMDSTEMAGRLSGVLGRPLTADGVRQMLRRARKRFAELILDEVTQSLDTPTPGDLDGELVALGLFEYCRDVLGQRKPAD